jgi:TonB family protein
MERLFDGKVRVDHSHFYIVTDPDLLPDMTECFDGQDNGLCGAAQPGVLFLMTGLHMGSIRLSVELWDCEPPLDDTWEEIVEVSFAVRPSANPMLTEPMVAAHPLKLGQGTFRVRYLARNMEAGRKRDVVFSSEEPVDSYGLMFWRARKARDRLIKRTSECAGYWHAWAREIPPASIRDAEILARDLRPRPMAGPVLQMRRPRRLHYVQPEYPAHALENGIDGYVTVDYVVNTRGEPTRVQAVDAHPAGVFEKAAIAAVQRWRFEPLVIDGTPREMPRRETIRFSAANAGMDDRVD